ncbi:type II restriction endonuclease [Helicobacter salomonis]|uniref:type II restriction endonuclease n=1 Tax=Helicobacter salomonis TaxID=56878 RepID=UPI000CF16275|nr:type II restriction endonuclease [Helicobacter salomonis]
MKNTLPFATFMQTLKKTNRALDFFVDWDKCLFRRDQVRLCLHHLNFLLGVKAQDLPQKVAFLFQEYPKAFQVLPLLLAVRNAQEIVLTPAQQEVSLDSYTQNPEGICAFLAESGLLAILAQGHINDLNDFVLGVEVGLDSNARKNRSGTLMESHLRQVFSQAGLIFKEQVSVTRYSNLHAKFGADIKKFDFVITGTHATYFIECNFYSSGGSKLNEVARAYTELALHFETEINQYFIWITDGQGWLEAKNKLQEAYKSVRLYNLSQLDSLISEITHA